MLRMPTVIDLFSGCGGLSTGLLDSGYQVPLGVDNDAPSLITYDYNHAYRGSRSLLADVSELRGSDLLLAAGVDRLDVLAGGPPCQPFSIAGKRRGLDDPRGKLIAEFLRLVRETTPEVVLFENVPAVATAHEGKVLYELETELQDMGYKIASGVLLAAAYGVPQNRRRLIVLAVRGVRRVPFPPTPTHGAEDGLAVTRYRTSRDAIGDLLDVNAPEADLIPNHEPTNHTPKMLDAFMRLAPGRREPGSYHDRLHPDRPSYTLRAGSGNFSPLRPVHYEYHRVVTVRESARIQGFSDDFIWPDSLSRLQQYRQVGNAVPPPLAEAL
ncbi:MAG: DNA cytosine methyltransferase, partial [Micromonosporaceae bacterium]